MAYKPKRIVLLSCVSTKLDHPAPARELYDSPLFKKSLAYAESIRPDDIVILSAKYYVIPLDKKIAPYDLTLLDMPIDDVREWAVHCLHELAGMYDLERDHFIILAGEKYRKFITPQIKHWEAPLEGLKIGEQMHWYDQHLHKIKEMFIKIKNMIYECFTTK
jgi:hypothetical protein